jgi:hypothetical protein
MAISTFDESNFWSVKSMKINKKIFFSNFVIKKSYTDERFFFSWQQVAVAVFLLSVASFVWKLNVY